MINKNIIIQPYLKTLTMLCVDESEIIKTIYQDIFGFIFKEILFASNATEGLALYEEYAPDMIITGQRYEEYTGMDMIQKIRKSNKRIPIILATDCENIELLRKALENNIQHYIQKPFDTSDIIVAVEDSARALIGDIYIEEKMDELQHKVEYSDFQENLALQKSLRVVKNDFYYKKCRDQDPSRLELIDFLYKAKDVVSGDSYGARKLNDDSLFIFLVDGMGKGISASLSSMITATLINRIVDKILEKGREFCLEELIKRAIKSTHEILLEDEILSASFFVCNAKTMMVEYAIFSMPPALIQDEDDNIITLKSNNPPINRYIKNFKIGKQSSVNLKKFLAYTDGIVENPLNDDTETYAKYIQEDFLRSQTREGFNQRIQKRIKTQSDDMTFVLLNKISLNNSLGSLYINSTLDDVEKANEWFEEKVSSISSNTIENSKVSIAFSELLTNAFEHGNLGISNTQKHLLMKDEKYFEYIREKEKECLKKISIRLYTLRNVDDDLFLITIIADEGEGFDTRILENVFGINKTFNSRGIDMSKKSSLGIYYNHKANEVTFINKL